MIIFCRFKLFYFKTSSVDNYLTSGDPWLATGNGQTISRLTDARDRSVSGPNSKFFDI